MKLTELELEVLREIKPKPEEYELLHRAFNRVREAVARELERQGIEAEVTVQGSLAHDTWLSGDRDIDVFVLFPKTTPIEELRGKYFQVLVNAVASIGEYELRYAEHPYVRVHVNGVEADIVPAYKLDSPSEVRTAVDRTPFHTEYVNSKLTNELRDHVRLLKKFMKSIGVYGAEIRVKGFSGYAVELLVIAYGGFREAIKEISTWKPPVYINTLGDREKFAEVAKKLREKYPESVVYAPDPVDPMRNTMASVSRESLAKIVIAANCYLNNPSREYFVEKARTAPVAELLRSIRDRCIVLLELGIANAIPPDTLWGELYRIADRVSKVLANHEFYVLDYSVWSDEKTMAVIALEIDSCSKTYPRLYRGPSFWIRGRAMDFIKKHIERNSYGPWISRRGELLSLSKRKYSNVIDLLIDRSWEYLVAPHFKNAKPLIYALDGEALTRITSNREVHSWITEFILKRPDWMEKCID